MVMSIVLGSILLLLEIFNIISIYRSKKSEIFKNSKKATIFLIIYCFIVCIIILIMKNSVKEMLLLLLLIIPLSFNNVNVFNEKYIYLKRIIRDSELTKDIVKRYNKAGIYFIKKDKNDLKFKEVTLEEYKKIVNVKNVFINDNVDNKKIDNAIVYNGNLEEFFNQIKTSRGIVDNYVKSISYVIMSSLLFSLSYVILVITGFPASLNLNNILLFKLLIVITSRYLYKKFPYDTDLMERSPRIKNILYSKQEKFLLVFQLLVMMFGLTMPYMYFVTGGISNEIAFMVLMITYLFILLFYTILMVTEKIFVKNLIYIFKNIYLGLYVILIIGISFLLNDFWHIMNLQNYIACCLVAIVFVVIYDIIKFARFTTINKGDMNGVKNNKKHK